jgi:hypothetical protein
MEFLRSYLVLGSKSQIRFAEEASFGGSLLDSKERKEKISINQSLTSIPLWKPMMHGCGSCYSVFSLAAHRS